MAALFGIGSYPRSTQVEQPRYSSEQSFLLGRISHELENLSREGFDQNKVIDFVSKQDLGRFKPYALNFLDNLCEKVGLTLETVAAVVAQQQKQQGFNPHPSGRFII